jgi:fructosamine-3-kinase
MMRGEFEALSAIEKVSPGFVPHPHAWGKFKDATPTTYFFLMDFHHFSHDLPDPAKFTAKIADLHRRSVSPNGKFGFVVPTCKGKMVQNTTWSDSWAEVFTRLMVDLHEVEIAVNGPWPEYEKAFKQLCDVVIPQLLGALQEDGQKLKPCLIHGDMWEENVATDLETGDPMVYDCSAMYAHNEFELGHWRRDGSRLGKNYIRQYLRRMPPSEPVEQWEDRTRLYAMEFNISHIAHWACTPAFRQR